MRKILTLFFIFVATLGLSGCMPSSSPPPAPQWHQHYASLDRLPLLLEAHHALTAAIALHGSPINEIRHIHLRQSQAARSRNRITRADILDWPAVRRKMQMRLVSPPASTTGPTLRDELAIVQQLNALQKSHPDTFSRAKLDLLLAGAILPTPRSMPVRTGIELCEALDTRPGHFVLYLRSAPERPEFKLELFHEVHHLLNPNLYDWYMEGLCTLFAEKYARRSGADWGPWADWMGKRRMRHPYAIAYFMMREIDEVVGPQEIRRLLTCTTPFGRERNTAKSALDTPRWLDSLPPAAKRQVTAILQKYGPQLSKRQGKRNAFLLPAGIHKKTKRFGLF